MRLYPLDRLNLILGIVLIILVASLLKPEAQAPALLALDAQTVNELRISRDGKLQLALLRDDQGWMLTNPDIQRADARRVARLLGLLDAPGVAVPDVAASDAGLQPPGWIFEVDSMRLQIGAPSTPPGQRYVEWRGEVFLIDEQWYRLLTLPASFYQAQ